MDKPNFEENAKALREVTVEPLTLAVLSKMLDLNVKYFDTHYIQARTKEILEKTISKLDFKSEEIQKARRAFLDVLIDGAAKRIYGFDDDRKMAKGNLKKKNKKQEAKDVLDKLDRLEKKVPRDKTEERDMECEPVCQLIAKMIFDPAVLARDEETLNGAIELDNELGLSIPVMAHFEELVDQLYRSLDESYKRANEKLWGDSRHNIRMKAIDLRIKDK